MHIGCCSRGIYSYVYPPHLSMVSRDSRLYRTHVLDMGMCFFQDLVLEVEENYSFPCN